MELEKRINEILNSDKFGNLSVEQKQIVKECILANCLILSSKNQDKYLNIISNNLEEIEDLGNNYFFDNGICYEGIVITNVSGNELSENVFPYNFKLKYKEFSSPLSRLTRSILHEFGHLAVKNPILNLNDSKDNEKGELFIDLGGLIISESLKKDFGHGFNEVLNEFTTFLAFKSYLAYRPKNEIANAKMREFAQKNGLSIEEKNEHLDILPNDLFTEYPETFLSYESHPDGTKEMFNPLYVKFTPLVKLIMRAFQNPMYTYQDLMIAFKNGEGLSAIKNRQPINDLFYGYYESSFHTQKIFDDIMKDQISWEQFCNSFDEQLGSATLSQQFLSNSIEIINRFYEARVNQELKNGTLTEEFAKNQLEDFYRVSENCLNFYQQQNSIKII